MKPLRKILPLFRKGKLDADMAEEMRLHLEQRTHENIAAGLPPDDARYAAQRKFGNVALIQEHARDQRGWMWLDQFGRDLRHAARALHQNLGFSTIVVLTLALGIGACTAIFSVVDRVLLRPLAYAESERLVVLSENKLPQIPRFAVAPGNYFDWRTQSQSFEQLAAVRGATYNLTGTGEPVRLTAQRITPNYLATLRTRPVLGRDFTVAEAAARTRVALLSHGLWQRQFGGRPDVLNETLQLNGQPFAIVGVLPENFDLGGKIELFTPIDYADGKDNHGGHNYNVYGRLKPGVTLEQARSELALIASRLAQQYPDTNTGWSVTVTPLLESTVGGVRLMLWALLGAVGFLLLIACANVASLQLARATARAKEIALRTALGASRGCIVRQLLAESLLLSALGGALGVLAAQWGTAALLAFAPDTLPRATEIALDARALAFTSALTLLTGVGFGLVPALQASRVDVNTMLKDAGRGTSAGSRRHRVRSSLVVAEIALALVLLAGAGLLFRSFARLQNAHPGFQPAEALAVNLTLPGRKYGTPAQQAAFVEQASARLAALPGVQSVGLAHCLPFSDDDYNLLVRIVGAPPVPAGTLQSTLFYAITPDYFSTMGIPLRRGRFFTAADAAGAPRVAIVGEAMAKKYFPNTDPIGQRINLADGDAEIVGLVADVEHFQLGGDARPQTYEPFAQVPFAFMTFVVRVAPSQRSAGAPSAALSKEGLPAAIRAAIYSVDKDQPIATIRPLSALVAGTVASPRLAMFLFAVFSGVAVLLAALGIYGVMAYAVTQRTSEIGIRLALGAQRTDVLRLIFTQGGRLIVLGLAAGLLGAFALTRFLATLLYNVSATDPLTFAAVAALLAAVAILACLLPARRATQVDPMVALRSE